MGKWSSYEAKLPKFEAPPTWQAKVDEAKDKYRALELKELARAMGQAQEEKDQHEDTISLCNVEIEALSQLLIDEMRAQNMEKVSLDNGSTVSIDIQPYSSTEDKQKLLDYLRRFKIMRDLLTINYQTLSALNKDRLIQGKSPIPGTKMFVKISAKLRRPRNESESEAA